MEFYIFISYTIGLLLNGYIFWLLIQITLAAWGNSNVSKKWVALVNTPVMQALPLKLVSTVLSVAMVIQLTLLVFLVTVSIYTGEPINLGHEK